MKVDVTRGVEEDGLAVFVVLCVRVATEDGTAADDFWLPRLCSWRPHQHPIINYNITY